jgi:hypothetical protein
VLCVFEIGTSELFAQGWLPTFSTWLKLRILKKKSNKPYLYKHGDEKRRQRASKWDYKR